jgi:hypothetical protein
VEIDNLLYTYMELLLTKNAGATLQVLDKGDSLFPDNY